MKAGWAWWNADGMDPLTGLYIPRSGPGTLQGSGPQAAMRVHGGV